MSAHPPMIEAVGLGKCYRLYESNGQRLLHALTGSSRSREHWALRDCNLRVERGEAVGIIGRNGSGKSTLLELIAGTLKRTTGSIAVRGRVAALLELGSGFNPEYTGRENVFLNGAILGVPRRELERKYDEIADFAEIGEYIDQPVKEYSSGMLVRLAFAVQVAVVPDILIVDEALSVGDIFFQQKCFKRIGEIRGQGTTILFVSHDMGVVRDLCDIVVYLKGGQTVFQGPSHAAIHHYLLEGTETSQNPSPMQIPDKSGENFGFIEEFYKSACWVNDHKTQTGQRARLLAVALLDQNGIATQKVGMGEDVVFRVLYQVFFDNPVHITLMLKNRQGQMVSSTGTYALGTKLLSLQEGEYAILELRLGCMLEAGPYTYAISLGVPAGEPNRGENIGESPWLGPLQIEWDYAAMKAPFLGMFGLPCSAKFVLPGHPQV